MKTLSIKNSFIKSSPYIIPCIGLDCIVYSIAKEKFDLPLYLKFASATLSGLTIYTFFNKHSLPITLPFSYLGFVISRFAVLYLQWRYIRWQAQQPIPPAQYLYVIHPPVLPAIPAVIPNGLPLPARCSRR